MSKNVVFITAIPNAKTADGLDKMEYKDYCLNTWKYWCDKNDVDLVLLDEEIEDANEMSATWQRYYVFDVLENSGIEYNQVAMVDLDTMIKWDTPNFFELTNNELSAVKDNEVVEWTYNSKNGYQHMFPNVDFNWWDYVNAGFIIVNHKHKKMFKKIIDFYHTNKEHLLDLQYNKLRKGSDQTPFNYMIRKMGCKITYLPKIYNMTSLHRKGILEGGLFIEIGNIWHFNGFDKESRVVLMKQTWENIRGNYE